MEREQVKPARVTPLCETSRMTTYRSNQRTFQWDTLYQRIRLFTKTINLLNTRPAITQWTGSIIEEEIEQSIPFPIGRIIDFSKLVDIY